MRNINSFDKYSEKRVSYILITKNRAKLLEKSLLNTKKLITKDDELIVIDGGSTDKTFEVVRKYKSLVNKFVSESDLMPSHAGNKGVLLAEGKYIKMLTDDDIVYSKAMEKAVEIMNKYPELDILECGGTRYRKATKKREVIYRPPGSNYPRNIDDAFKVGINVMGLVIRRTSLSKIGLFPLNLLTDSLFLVQALKNGANIKFARINLYHQTIYSFSINQAKRDELAPLFFNAVKNNASKKYFWRFAFNWFLQKHPIFKPFFYPIIIPLYLLKKIDNENEPKTGTKYIWDGGFS